MAKDAKGHGSEKRGSSLASVPNSGGKYPAFDKFWAGSAGASVDKAAQDAAAASELGQGHPKAGPVPVHSGAMGPSGLDPANSSEERARIYGQRLRSASGRADAGRVPVFEKSGNVVGSVHKSATSIGASKVADGSVEYAKHPSGIFGWRKK